MVNLPLSRTGKAPIDVARPLVYEAGGILRDRFHTKLQIRHKGRADVVTDVDLEVEQFVVARLRDEFPDFGILAEESGEGGAAVAEYTWIVDPLDGTRNYSVGVPQFAVTFALARGEEVVLGLTYDPTRDELFSAEKDGGVFLNDEKVHVSPHTALADAVIGTDMGYSDAMAGYALQLLDRLWPGMQAIRIMGSAALGLAYAASGRLSLYFHHQLAPWDIAAGIIMAHEAGGVVTNRDGSPISIHSPNIILGNTAIHAEFLDRTRGLPWRTA